jgi:hypothetical protein
MVTRQKALPARPCALIAGPARRIAGSLVLGALLVLPACRDLEGPAPGAPVLAGFDVVDASGAAVDLAMAAAGVSPRVHFALRFDRLLDGDQLEDVTDAGVTGKPGVATITAAGQPQVAVSYVPNGDGVHKLLFAPGPQLLITPTPTLPAGSSVTVAIDKSRFRGKAGEGPLVIDTGVSDSLTFTTAPFAVAIGAGDAAASPDAGTPLSLAAMAAITVAFNNLPAAQVASHIAVVVTDAAGQPVADAAEAPAASDMDPSLWTVAPKPAGWLVGATVTVTVDASAADVLGMPLPAATSAAFTVAP